MKFGLLAILAGDIIPRFRPSPGPVCNKLKKIDRL